MFLWFNIAIKSMKKLISWNERRVMTKSIVSDKHETCRITQCIDNNEYDCDVTLSNNAIRLVFTQDVIYKIILKYLKISSDFRFSFLNIIAKPKQVNIFLFVYKVNITFCGNIVVILDLFQNEALDNNTFLPRSVQNDY